MTMRAFTMPKWGIEMSEGLIGEWTVAEGAAIAKGQVIATIESDKITNEVEAEFPGVLARLIAKPGETLPVGALLAVITDGGESDADVAAFIASFKGADSSFTPDEPAPAPAAAAAPAAIEIPKDLAISPKAAEIARAKGVDVTGISGSGRKGRITAQDVDQAAKPAKDWPKGAAAEIAPLPETAFASPLARRLAAQHGVDLATLAGSGRHGRISKADVLAAARPKPGAVETVKMSPMRKAIARRLTESKSTIPHFYLRSRVQLDALLARRGGVSVTAWLTRAAALALKAHPDVNIQVHGDEIHRFASADIAVAVATDKGLLTPVVRGADAMSAAEIGAEIARLADKARAGKLQPEDMEGGSFSISNLGMFGVEQFDAIINPPQGAILAVGASIRTPVEINYALAFATLCELSLSCDHRAIDGAVGGRFLSELKRLIEAPELL